MAGTWGDVLQRSNASVGGAPLAMFAVAREFTADASTAAITDWPITGIDPAILTDIGVVFDGTTAPNPLTITAKDADGLTAWTSTFTASGRVACDERPALVGGVTLSFTGNTTNSAKAKIIAYFASNLR